MDGRHFSSGDRYSYSFQGQLHDDEIKGEGNSINFEYRMHDPRVGRFFAIDPLTKDYPELTPYQFSSNSPIFMRELEGLEGTISVTTKWHTNKGIEKSKTKVYTVEGLKCDVLKTCWKGENDPSGPVNYLQYRGRNSDGTGTGSVFGYNVDDKPTVPELNELFAGDITNSYNVKEQEKQDAIEAKENENWYDGTIFAPDALEGNDDPANLGDPEALENVGKIAAGFIQGALEYTLRRTFLPIIFIDPTPTSYDTPITVVN